MNNTKDAEIGVSLAELREEVRNINANMNSLYDDIINQFVKPVSAKFKAKAREWRNNNPQYDDKKLPPEVIEQIQISLGIDPSWEIPSLHGDFVKSFRTFKMSWQDWVEDNKKIPILGKGEYLEKIIYYKNKLNQYRGDFAKYGGKPTLPPVDVPDKFNWKIPLYAGIGVAIGWLVVRTVEVLRTPSAKKFPAKK